MTPAPQPGSPRRKSSIFLKLFCSVTLCVVLLLVFNWLLNSFVLVSYYQSAKEQSLRDAFTRVDSLLNGGSEQLETELYRLNGNENIKTIIWSRSTVLYNFRVGETMQVQLPSLDLENGTYVIQVSENERLQSNDITLAGRFSNGYSVIMQTPIAAIEKSVDITNQFLLISGTVTLDYRCASHAGGVPQFHPAHPRAVPGGGERGAVGFQRPLYGPGTR